MSVRKLKKVTYSLPEDLIDRVRLVVDGGAAPSYSAFVEKALSDLVHRAYEKQLQVAFESAGTDPGFLADIDQAMRRFDSGGGRTDREEL